MLKKLIAGAALFVIIQMSATVLMPAFTNAATAENCVGAQSNSFFGFPTWYKYLDFEFSNGECNLDFTIPDDAGKIVLAIFEIILRIGGLAAVAFIIVGGFQYLISQGEPERTKGAKSTILNAMIGLVITMFATAIVNLIGRNIF